MLPADASANRTGAEIVEAGGPGQDGRWLDEDSRRWLVTLADSSPDREQAVERLHEMLLGVARAELHRRSGRHAITGPELDDLAHQAAGDALLAIITKLAQFRGESRFTTWAYRFVILEVSTKLGRHFWQRPAAVLDTDGWDRLPDRFGIRPEDYAQGRELVTTVRRAVEEELTERQRQVFVAIVVSGIPLDALVAQLGSNRNAIYKTMFDARRKLRAALVANGYLPMEAASKDAATRRRS